MNQTTIMKHEYNSDYVQSQINELKKKICIGKFGTDHIHVDTSADPEYLAVGYWQKRIKFVIMLGVNECHLTVTLPDRPEDDDGVITTHYVGGVAKSPTGGNDLYDANVVHQPVSMPGITQKVRRVLMDFISFCNAR